MRIIIKKCIDKTEKPAIIVLKKENYSQKKGG